MGKGSLQGFDVGRAEKLGGDPEDEAREGEAEGDEEVEMVLAEDPYFERRPGGRRAREIPDIAKFLDAKREAKARAGSGA